MGMRVLEGVGFAVLTDSTSGIAFGPVFAGEWEVEELLDWCQQTGATRDWHGRDLRPVSSADIADMLAAYRNERDNEGVAA